MPAPPAPLLPVAGIDALRTALTGYTVDALDEVFGPVGQSAQRRGDLAGMARAVADVDDARLATLVRLFLLGALVPARDAARALAPLSLDLAVAAGIVTESGGEVRAGYDIRPYAEDGESPDPPEPWWVVSDLGADVRGSLEPDHVLGIGAAALTLAQATPRTAVRAAADIGTGCGIQALHLARHAETVLASDISPRALRLAATTAALSGQRWELRQGSLLAPLGTDRFDLVVANPPFVVSPAGAGPDHFDYRDSGLPGDEVCRRLVTGLPDTLAPGGTAQLLANWIVPSVGSWQDRLEAWFAGTGCDAWVWRRETAEPAEYVALWLRDAGDVPGSATWTRRYDAWLDWFAATGVAAIGMGLVTMWRTDAAQPTVVIEDVPQAIEQPAGRHVATWPARQRWLAARRDAELLSGTYAVADGLVRTQQELLDADGWAVARATLRQSYGMRWEVEVDDPVAAVVAACAAGATPALACELLAATPAGGGAPSGEIARQLVPVLRDLVARGFLVPEALVPEPLVPEAMVPPRPVPAEPA